MINTDVAITIYGRDEEEMPSPGSIFAHIDGSDDDNFFSLVEGWFKKNYPEDELN